MVTRTGERILRIGLAFAFLYPAIDAYFDPYSWLGYFPSWMHGIVPDMVLLHSWGAFEIIVALWLLSGWKIVYPAILAFLSLLAIVILDYRDFEITFRDLSIASIALALALTAWPHVRGTNIA